MPTPRLTREVLQETLDAWEEHNRVKGDAAAALGLNQWTYDHRLRVAKQRLLGIHTGRGAPEGEPKADTPAGPKPRTLEQDIALARAQGTARDATSKLKDASREINRLRDKVLEYETVGRISYKPAAWTLNEREAGKSEHIPVLFTSDFQVGEVVRPEETEHGYGYDVSTFRRRYRAMIEATIYLSFNHAGKEWTYPGIIYLRGGDSISGGIHEELAETDEVSAIEAVEIAFEEESAGIEKLAGAFGRVEVKDCGGGNHDRTTKKPRSKHAYANFDKLINFMLRQHFREDPRVSFQITESMDVVFSVYEMNILLTHGDRIGSRGGQGFIGPAATVLRGAQKVIMEQVTLKRNVDIVMMGHFHVPMVLSWAIVNGSLPGYTEYAKMNRMRPEQPQQSLFYFHQGRGIVDYKPLKLT